jgi:hypothetical protein
MEIAMGDRSLISGSVKKMQHDHGIDTTAYGEQDPVTGPAK